MGMSCSNDNHNRFKEFVFDESLPEDDDNHRRNWAALLLSQDNNKKKNNKATKSSSVYSGADNYDFLQSFAGGGGNKLKLKLRKDKTNERISRSDAALQSTSSNYNSKSSHNLTSHKNAKDSDRNQHFHLTDSELVSIPSDDDDDDIENASTMSSNDFADAQGGQDLEHEMTSDHKESSVVVFPECVTYGRSCYSTAQLTFFRNSVKLDVSEEGATGCLTFEWKTQNLISIESRWLDPLITAEVCLLIKSENSQKSGILEVKFTLSDSCWSNKQDLIKSLDEQYKEIWDVDLDSYELFEDITLEGDGDSIAISKRDFQLLQPEKFINDTIVDFYIEHLKKIKSVDARVHFFNSFFFRKLADFDENQSRSVDSKEAFQRVRKWTKKVDIFQKDYIFIPVNFRLHWSLIIICHPGEVVNFTDEELENSLKVPCILHMDSIKGSHRGLEDCIKCYLWEEWKERNNSAPKDISIKFRDLRFLRLEVPQQENSYDCALFMLHFMELFVKQASEYFNPLNTFINREWFYPVEASLKRARIKRLIFELSKSNTQQFVSPKSSFELKDEDDEEEEADVEILHETCNSKKICVESIADTSVNKARDVTPLFVSRNEHMETDCLDTDIDGGSMMADNEQKNHGQMVLYDPSTSDMSQIKKSDKSEDFGDKQLVVVPENKKITPIVTCIDKSMNQLQLKDKSAGEENVFESHVVKDSDDDVFETCVVEDTDADCDSDVAEIDSIVDSPKRRQRRPVGSVGRKRPRRGL